MIMKFLFPADFGSTMRILLRHGNIIFSTPLKQKVNIGDMSQCGILKYETFEK